MIFDLTLFLSYLMVVYHFLSIFSAFYHVLKGGVPFFIDYIRIVPGTKGWYTYSEGEIQLSTRVLSGGGTAIFQKSRKYTFSALG